jgi:hypothetical protein
LIFIPYICENEFVNGSFAVDIIRGCYADGRFRIGGEEAVEAIESR